MGWWYSDDVQEIYVGLIASSAIVLDFSWAPFVQDQQFKIGILKAFELVMRLWEIINTHP